ncbi:hypothetical protein ABK905_11990 [Acerihabitans sp. KWT182]|uniref:Uncharacterized protein n=1 Tax=Acerihabitans sp. KWT182 TaxID=3157919 RepID=A0AAU7QEF6_9GAMM
MDLTLHNKIKALARELALIDGSKAQGLLDDELSTNNPESNYHALGLHNDTELLLKKIDPFITLPGYRHFVEGYHKTLQELKIKFLLKSIIENPLDWEDYDLCCEIYDGLINYYQSARCTLNLCDLTYQNITPGRIKRFLAVFKYNFAHNLAYRTTQPPADASNFHYYSLVSELSAQGHKRERCHRIACTSNALRIGRESYRESETQGEEKDALLIHLEKKDRHYRERYGFNG